MAPATAAELPAEVAAHLLELSELLGGQDTESVGFGLSGDNPEFGLDTVLSRRVRSEGTFVEDRSVIVGCAICITTVTKLLGVGLDFRAGLFDDGLDFAELLLAQAELLGQSRQHALEEA